MKKTLSFLTFLLALVIAFYAADMTGVADGLIDKVLWDTGELEGYTVPVSGKGTGYYRHSYEALGEIEKHAYALILQVVRTHPEKIRIPQLTEEQLSGVLTALIYDNPDMLCLSYHCTMSAQGKKFYFIPEYTGDLASCDKKTSELEKAAASVIAAASRLKGEYEKELYVHDYIIGHCAYADTESWSETSAYGALVKGKASCGGYSAAFKLILARMNIDTRLIVGTTPGEGDKNAPQNHMWNAVVINGKNYYVDVTWDDPTGNDGATLSHTYFNVTGAALKKTHTDILTPVSCTATADNYFVRKGLYFTGTGSAFKERVTDAFVKGAADGEKFLELRFSDITVYKKGVGELIEDGGLRRAFEKSGLIRRGGGYTVHYTEDAENCILSIALKSD